MTNMTLPIWVFRKEFRIFGTRLPIFVAEIKQKTLEKNYLQ